MSEFNFDEYPWPGAAMITARLACMEDALDAILDEWLADEDDAVMVVTELLDWITAELLPRLTPMVLEEEDDEDTSRVYGTWQQILTDVRSTLRGG